VERLTPRSVAEARRRLSDRGCYREDEVLPTARKLAEQALWRLQPPTVGDAPSKQIATSVCPVGSTQLNNVNIVGLSLPVLTVSQVDGDSSEERVRADDDELLDELRQLNRDQREPSVYVVDRNEKRGAHSRITSTPVA
jgi:hypothetical protein